jgi:GTP1/Obg family GTP-binding protein
MWGDVVYRRSEVRVGARQGKRHLHRVGLANKTSAGPEESLHDRCRFSLDARQRQQVRLTATGRVAGDIEDILNRQGQSAQGTRTGVLHRHRWVG